MPAHYSVLHKLCLHIGYSTTNDPCSSFDLAVKWRDSTQYNPDDVIIELSRRRQVVNINCNDISKSTIGHCFKKAFGYSIGVDPGNYVGKCVEKSNENYAHDGKILQSPVEEVREGYVYQKLIDTRVNDRVLSEYRVPVFSDIIPFVVYRHRFMSRRFGGGGSRNDKTATLLDTDEVLTQREVRQILDFCSLMGMDYGELDVLRDRGDGRIYIVDANNTPSGPNWHVVQQQGDECFNRMATAFVEAFMLPAERTLSSQV